MNEYRVMQFMNGKMIEGSCIKAGTKEDCEEAARRINRRPGMTPGTTYKAVPCIR